MNAVLAPPLPQRPASLADVDTAVEQLAQALARTAVARDQAGGHAAAERQLVRDSGLLTLTVPAELGGWGAGLDVMLKAVRRLAQADSALAHVFAFHHLQVASVLLYAGPGQREQLLSDTVSQAWFWGNALNPLDTRLVASPVPGGYRLDGQKAYCSGSVGSDRLMLTAHTAATPTQAPQLLTASLLTRSPGVTVREDWDAFGQRQTDSGSVTFDNVFLPQADVIVAPGTPPTARSTLRPMLSQLIMCNLYTGIAQGALQAGLAFTREQAKAWLTSGVARAADDPYIQHRYGQLWLLVRPAELASDAAAQQLLAALVLGSAVTAADRGRVAVAAAEAKVLAHRAGVEVSSQFLELTGARSTSARWGFDRYWRNARVHTLHDPVDYKLRDLGRFLLDGQPPEPGFYS